MQHRHNISLSQIAQMTGVDRSNVSRAINDLATAGVLSKRQGGYGQVLGLNKNYQKWAVAKIATRCQNDNRGVAKIATVLLPKQQPQKTTPKDNSKRSSIYFDEFWSAYPKKTGRKPSLAKWIARDLDSIAPKIIANVRARLASAHVIGAPKFRWGNVPQHRDNLGTFNHPRRDSWKDDTPHVFSQESMLFR